MDKVETMKKIWILSIIILAVILLINLPLTKQAVYPNQKISFQLASLQMKDGCNGDINLAPTTLYPLIVCVNDGITDYGCKTYTSGEYGAGSILETGLFSQDTSKNYRLKINWKRIRYINVDNPALNWKYDNGESSDSGNFCRVSYGYVCPFPSMYYNSSCYLAERQYPVYNCDSGYYPTGWSFIKGPVIRHYENYVWSDSNKSCQTQRGYSWYNNVCLGFDSYSCVTGNFADICDYNTISSLASYAGNTIIYTDYISSNGEFAINNKIYVEGTISGLLKEIIYSEFIQSKSNYLSGSNSFNTFIANANGWAQ